MATKKTVKKTAKKTTTKPKKLSPAEQEALDTKRAYYGLVFLGLAILVGFSAFNPSDAFLLSTFKNMVTFFIGYGVWFLPFSLGVIGIYCFLPFEGNVSLRCGSFIGFSLVASSFIHMVNHGSRYLITDLSVVISKATDVETGGLLGGLLAIVLEAALTEVGAMIVLLLVGIGLLLIGFNITPAQLMTSIKKYFENLAYEEQEEETQYRVKEKEKKKVEKQAKRDKQKEHTARLKQARAKELQKTYEEARMYAEVKTPKKLEKYEIDLPLDFESKVVENGVKVSESTEIPKSKPAKMDAWVIEEYERLKKNEAKRIKENKVIRESLNENFGFNDDMFSSEMLSDEKTDDSIFDGTNPQLPKQMLGQNEIKTQVNEVAEPKYTIFDHKMGYGDKGDVNVEYKAVATDRNYEFPEMQVAKENMFANQNVDYKQNAPVQNGGYNYGVQNQVNNPYNEQISQIYGRTPQGQVVQNQPQSYQPMPNQQMPNNGQVPIYQQMPNQQMQYQQQVMERQQQIANNVAREAQVIYQNEQDRVKTFENDPTARTMYYQRMKQNVEVDFTRTTMKFGAYQQEDPKNVINPMRLYSYPPISLLGEPHTDAKIDPTEELRDSSESLVETLGSFGIKSEIMHIVRGPSVTRFEITIAKGVKYSKLAGLSDDIGLALGAASVRIATIPEKGAIGIEVPNKTTDIVTIREVLDTPEFVNQASKLSYTLGKDITGRPVIGDIAKMPHMMIAGTTGSGKSVCVNSMLVSLLYKSNPDEVKFIMIDPKMVELGGYNGIPHLLIPVVTDPKKAAGALSWAVGEMERRYGLMESNRVKDIDMYNKVAERKQLEGNTEIKTMPRIVIVIDELADLMMVAAKDVEESICRIAQKARAAGMHLVIATQRPSADVITGIMKANVPSRVSFAVSSQIESRIILDTSGAEKLIGKGDMLYNPLGASKPNRIQGCFITGTEVDDVVDFVKSNADPDYNEEVMTHIESHSMKGEKDTGPSGGGSSDDEDELIIDAIDAIVQSGTASVSFLQRKLRLGFSRAGRIIDQIEDRGIIGSSNGAKPREILISKYDWQEMRARMSES